MRLLSESERRLCAFVESFTESNGVPPRFEECGQHLGGITKQAISLKVRKLEQDGFLERRADCRERFLQVGPAWRTAVRRACDLRTNPLIAQVADDRPELFSDFTQDDWQSLYAMRGMGGALTREGVERAAVQIPENRRALDAVAKLLVNEDTRGPLLEKIEELRERVEISPGRATVSRRTGESTDEHDVSRDRVRGRRRRSRPADAGEH